MMHSTLEELLSHKSSRMLEEIPNESMENLCLEWTCMPFETPFQGNYRKSREYLPGAMAYGQQRSSTCCGLLVKVY